MFAKNPTRPDLIKRPKCTHVFLIDNKHACVDFNQVQEYAAKKGGACLSDKYVSAKKLLLWKCAQGHVWPASWDNVSSKLSPTWCPDCSESCSAGEVICRAALQHMWPGFAFQKERPVWLTNQNGHRLELDGVNHELKIAFEYDGIQHVTPVTCAAKITPDDALRQLERQQEHDAIKTRRLLEEGYLLLRVPHTTKLKDIYSLLSNQCAEGGKTHPTAIVPFDHKAVAVGKQGVYQYWRQYALEMGGCLTSLQFHKSSELMDWKCASGHNFRLSANAIQAKGVWCSKCADTRLRMTLEELQFAANLNGGSLVSQQYTGNNNADLEWQCSNGHVFLARPRYVRAGHWCLKCSHSLKQSQGAEAMARKKAKATRVQQMKDYRMQIKKK